MAKAARINLLRYRTSRLLCGVKIVAGTAVVLPLLPVLLPLALAVGAVSDARMERKLARTKCKTCGEAIGLVEIRRAKVQGRASAATRMQAVLAAGHIPRIVAVWDVICPACGHAYIFRPSTQQRILESVA